MGNKNKKKMNLSSLLKSSAGGLLSLPLCYNANKTLSFRLGNGNDDIIKTVNSVFFDHSNNSIKDLFEIETTPESWFTTSSESASHSTESDDETVLRGVIRSERLFFDPGVTSSILDEPKLKSEEEEKAVAVRAIEEMSVAVAMESEDPYSDFKRSMEEMVTSHRELVKDWESLESMLAWYLKMNDKKSHGIIVSAFVDLLAGIGDSGAGTSSESARYSTAVSSSLPSSPFCGSSNQTEIEELERRSV